MPSPVEPALEANESAVTPKNKNVDKRSHLKEQAHSQLERQNSNDETPKLVRLPVGSLPPLTISPSKQNISIQKNKIYDIEIQSEDIEYVGKTGGEVNSNATSKIRYEIPENSISRTAARILGNRRELEMHEFSSSKLASEDGISDSGRRIPTNMPEIDPSGERQPID